ncbi:MAG: hypothetical protein AAF328_11735 [Planctomycetota bacterium]
MPETLTSKPVILLIVLAVLAAGIYLYRGCAGGPTLEVQLTRGPEGMTFLFNGRVGLEELIVTADPDGEARVVWHLVPRVDDDGDEVEPRPQMAVTYGQRWGLGMRPAPETPRDGEALEPGVTYEFFADTTAGNARKRFTMPDA